MIGYAPCLSAGDSRGFEIDEAEVVFWGRCPECVAVAGGGSPEQTIRNEPEGTTT